MKKFAALFVALAMVLGVAAPAGATVRPKNVMWSWNDGACGWQFLYGEAFGTAFAQARVTSGHSGNPCYVATAKVAYTYYDAVGSAFGNFTGSPWYNSSSWRGVNAGIYNPSNAFAHRFCLGQQGIGGYWLVMGSVWDHEAHVAVQSITSCD